MATLRATARAILQQKSLLGVSNRMILELLQQQKGSVVPVGCEDDFLSSASVL